MPDATAATVKVWDPLVRVGHWLLVACIAVAWASGEGGQGLHEACGYAAMAIIAIRLVWGFIGPHYARFAEFLRSPTTTLHYGLRVLAGNEPRYLGHNPLGGWMIVCLIGFIALTGVSGWLYTTDQYFGVEWVGELHETLADVLLGLIGLHIAGVVVASRRHHENLAGAMLHGRKRGE